MAGGGTAGHVYPNLALVPSLREHGVRVEYLGRPGSMEQTLAEEAGLSFCPVDSERFFRYFTLRTLLTPFKVIHGICQTVAEIHRKHPSLIFCKGGFGSLPPAVGGWLTGTPVILHESDMTPGLANRLCMPFARKICVTFQDTLAYTRGKGVYTGVPIRQSLTEGKREKGFSFTGLDPHGKPVVMIIGGSSGARALNQAVAQSQGRLLEEYQLIHLYGGKQEEAPPVSAPEKGYFAESYAKEELADLFAAADVVVSRAGSTAINELLLLRKPNILVPLPLTASRGDQIVNAQHFEKLGFSKVLAQEQLSTESLLEAIREVLENKDRYRQVMSSDKARNGVKEVTKVILACRKQ